MKELIGLCERCKKNKATMQFSQSVTDFTHGFVENICQECYDKIKHENTWYKDERKEVIEEIIKDLDKWDMEWIINSYPNSLIDYIKDKLKDKKE